MRPLWDWSGVHHRRAAAEKMWSTTSYVRAVAAGGAAAPAVETTCSLSHVSWDWPTPESTSATSWLTPSTPLKYKLSMECLTRVLIRHNTHLSTLPPTRLVRLTQCLHVTIITAQWFDECPWVGPLVSVSVACLSVSIFYSFQLGFFLFFPQHHQQCPSSTRSADPQTASLCPGPSPISPMELSWTMSCSTTRRYISAVNEESVPDLKTVLATVAHIDIMVVQNAFRNHLRQHFSD